MQHQAARKAAPLSDNPQKEGSKNETESGKRLAVEAVVAPLKETEEAKLGKLKEAGEQVGSGRYERDALDIVSCLPPPVANSSEAPE